MNRDDYLQGLQKDERYTLREKKAVLYIKAKNEAVVITLDDGIIKKQDDQKICDYLYCNLVDKSSHFIELKGSNKAYALKQILDTIILIENHKIHYKYIKDAGLVKGYIVSSCGNTPNIEYSNRKKLNRKLRSISKVKLNQEDYVLFVKCVSKVSGQPINKKNHDILNSNDFPLII